MQTEYAASYIDVVDNRTTSIKNTVGRDYSARNAVNPVYSEEVFYVANGFYYRNVGDGANDRIDHFDGR